VQSSVTISVIIARSHAVADMDRLSGRLNRTTHTNTFMQTRVVTTIAELNRRSAFNIGEASFAITRHAIDIVSLMRGEGVAVLVRGLIRKVGWGVGACTTTVAGQRSGAIAVLRHDDDDGRREKEGEKEGNDFHGRSIEIDRERLWSVSRITHDRYLSAPLCCCC